MTHNLILVQQFIVGKQNKHTLKKTMQDVAIVLKFLKMKKEVREIQRIPHEELYTLLASFILKIRKKDGSSAQNVK